MAVCTMLCVCVGVCVCVGDTDDSVYYAVCVCV